MAIRNRPYPGPDQEAILQDHCGHARYVWNLGVEQQLVRDNDLIVLEQLSTKILTRRPVPKPDPDQPGAYLRNRARSKAGLNQAILASCWGLLGQRLNAARNILARGLAATGGEIPARAPGHGAVCPHQPLATVSAAGTREAA